jgi:alpha-beta hydrolase superfamily lysophospholipase
MGFSVAAYDLPGHGLSSGKRMDINDFSEYAAVLNDFIRYFAPQLPEPQYLVGHSTGCAIAFEYLHQHTTHHFDRIFFLAPLVHSRHWWLSKTGYRMIAPFVDKIRRKFKENTSDREYLTFLAKDPLQSRSIPLSWVKAMFTWEDRIHRYPRIDQPVCIIQGTEDTVVDWKYNISFLQTKFGSTRVRMIPGAKHQLINERKDLRSNVFNEIRYCMEGGKTYPQ